MRIRISGYSHTKQFLAATKLNKDDVNTRFVLIHNPGDVHAADVMCHSTGMSSGILKFKNKIESLVKCDGEVDDGYVKNLFERIYFELQILI